MPSFLRYSRPWVPPPDYCVSFRRLGTFLARSVELEILDESLEVIIFVADGRLSSFITGLMAAANAVPILFVILTVFSDCSLS